MTEQALWIKLKKFTNPNILRLFRVENRVSKSMPDVLYNCKFNANGWMELKWTAKPSSKVTFQNGQAEWLYNWCLWGGSGIVLVGHRDMTMSVYWGADFWDPKTAKALRPDPRIILSANQQGFDSLTHLIKEGFSDEAFLSIGQ